MAGWRMNLKGGRPVSGDRLLSLVAPHVKRAGLVIQGGVMQTSPVKQGHLRRGWTTGNPEKSAKSVSVKVGNAVVYARYQNERTRNKGYVQRGINTVKADALNTLRDGIKGEASKLWDKGAG